MNIFDTWTLHITHALGVIAWIWLVLNGLFWIMGKIAVRWPTLLLKKIEHQVIFPHGARFQQRLLGVALKDTFFGFVFWSKDERKQEVESD